VSKEDVPSWVNETISKMGQHCMKKFRQKQMKLDHLMHSRWGDTANYFDERDTKYETNELIVLAVVELQIPYRADTS
jgi:hypothetical protein